uniref:zinc finger B-box domain-containing protein 1-like isoform X2 n=1 Tax=Styela clava TaxID=7725 RepID=UPI0019397A92|nr:zinc finger B-box domain-containing protein 1-like isoform X2 [Styela clava]
MSHHFAPEFTVLPPGKEAVSKKLQRNNDQTTSAKKREIQQLDFDNKQMEWKLNQIKQAMSKEKEDRGKQGYIWKSGESGKLESYARNILGRSVSATTVNGSLQRKNKHSNGSKSAPKSKPRVKVLKDEPLDLPKRDSRNKELIEKLKSNKLPNDVQMISGDFETERREDWIRIAVDKNSDDNMEMQSNLDGNLPLSSVHALDPTAIGIYFLKWGRKRLLMAVDGVIRRPKTGWGDELYFPYAGRVLPEMPTSVRPEPPLRNLSNTVKNTPRDEDDKTSGGALLQGAFNEEESAASFQLAVNDWRQSKKENIVSSSDKSSNEKKIPEMSVHVAQCYPPSYEVKFSETSTLSYMEHILLDKHRKSEVPPPMPVKSLSETVNGYLDPYNYNDADDNENVLTVDEQEERRRIRELFSPDKNENRYLADEIRIDEVSEDIVENTESTDYCIIEESPPPSPTPDTSRSTSTVVIEEVQYSEQNSVTESAISSVVHIDHHTDGPIIDDIEIDEKSELIDHTHSVQNFKSKSTKMKNEGKNHRIKSASFINNNLLMQDDLTKSLKQQKRRSKTSIGGRLSSKKEISTMWKPTASLVSPDLPSTNDEAVVTYIDSSQNDKILNSNEWKESNEYDSESDNEHNTREDDDKALNDLEWELASRTGNITSDGRISRLIDEWSEEDDEVNLNIIDDPGVGSGLSTPDVDRNCLSEMTSGSPNNQQFLHDFQNIEQMIMGDVSEEYSEEEL